MRRVRHILLCGLLIAVAPASAGDPEIATVTVGATYPIAEGDALQEIEARAARTQVSLDTFGDSDDWRATQSVVLPVAAVTATRHVTPFASIPFDIPDKDGNILYPKGFTFNPLEHVRFSLRLVVAAPAQLDWALEEAGEYGMVLLSGGNALKESDARLTPVFVLEAALAERLGLEVVPSIVEQEGAQFRIEEIAWAEIEEQQQLAANGGGE